MLSPIKAHKLFFVRFFSLTGRSCRSEFWWLLILELILFLLAAALIEAIWPDPNQNQALYATQEAFTHAKFIHALLNQVFLLLISLLFLSLNIRRLHDIGLSGWWMFAYVLPLIGGVLFVIAMLLPSQHKVNKYGADPTADIQAHYQYYVMRQDKLNGPFGLNTTNQTQASVEA